MFAYDRPGSLAIHRRSRSHSSLRTRSINKHPKLAWSLGAIQGYDRASITLTVSLPSTIPLQLDTVAQAFAMLDGASVSNSTPAATLRQGNVDPNPLASTPDATADPFLQEEAARLDYDPHKILDFLQNEIDYNSYLDSVRGARGMLWSGRQLVGRGQSRRGLHARFGHLGQIRLRQFVQESNCLISAPK